MGRRPGRHNGHDYVAYVDWNDGDAGTLWAKWMVQALHGQGNVIYTGGPAGNPVGADQLAAIVRVFANHPGMHLLTGDSEWPVTNWDPATAETVTASLLSQYPKIDGIISNYGTDALASAQAFENAGRKLVPIATLDANGLSCLYKSKKIPLETISSRNWLGRIAARKAIAAAEGITNDEPYIYNLPSFENTLHGKTYHCNPKASPDFYPSNKLTVAQIKQYGNAAREQQPSMSSPVVLRLTGVTKTFPGVVALERRDARGARRRGARAGRRERRGQVDVDGGRRRLDRPRPGDGRDRRPAARDGVAGRGPGARAGDRLPTPLDPRGPHGHREHGLRDARAARPRMSAAAAWTREQLAAVGAEIDPAERVADLSTANRQLVEIAKALALEARVLILDEPTEALTAVESERLFENIRAIRERGTAVVYISHRLPEVRRVADRLTVLRDGRTHGTFDAAGTSESEILRLIIGRAPGQAFPDKLAGEAPSAGRPLLEVTGLSGNGFDGVSLSARAGEIIGLAGIEGNGQRAFLRALAGLGPAHGQALLDGARLPLGAPARLRSAGVVHLPGDRHREGVMLSLSVRENVSLLALRELAPGGVVRRGRERGEVARLLDELGIRTPSQETAVAALSGGNQQKVLFARALLGAPRLLLADEPTRGVDAGARIDLYRVLREAAAGGRVVIVLSSDAIELQGLCDRVLVFSRGHVVRELEGDDIDEENITGTAVTSQAGRRAAVAAGVARLRRARRFVAGDYLPSAVLALLVFAVGLYTYLDSGRFLLPFSLKTNLLLASVLAFVAFGQLVIMLTGNFDLSVGPLMGLVVVVSSFFWATGQGAGDLVLGIVAVVGTGLAVGLVNALLVRVGRLDSIRATIATYIVIQGVALQLRPQEAGFLRADVTAAIDNGVSWMPFAFIVAVCLAIGAEVWLRRTRRGIGLRAVGSDPTRAHRLGARVNLTLVSAFVACALLTVAAGVMLAGQLGVGDGDPMASESYTLTSITAVVLGGASARGGRGSFLGALLGAVLLTELVSAVPFLQIALSWNYWFPGILILVGAGIYSRARGGRAAILGAGGAQ